MMVRVSPGERYGHLVFITDSPEKRDNRRVGLWQCDCGEQKMIPICRVASGYARSCGCLAASASRDCNSTHGMKYSPEYRSWGAMVGRCHNPNHKDYPRYGAVGITVCDEWRNSFESFFSSVGPRPNGTTIDRIDPFRGYEPGNVRWATPREQSHNRKDLTVINTPMGYMPLVDYAKSIGITKGAAHLRLKRGTLEGCSRE